MKNKEAAEDVLQEAYMKAFSKLDKLSEPEAFEGWLGTIVANTAQNALVRKNPLLFTDVAVDNEGEEFTYDVEDENPDNQPEMAYTREETRELVHSLMDSLSEEQRLCILMFHIEGASSLEIAEVMDCSENTVKSRLNYGRKNLKVLPLSRQPNTAPSAFLMPPFMCNVPSFSFLTVAPSAFMQSVVASISSLFSSPRTMLSPSESAAQIS